MKTCASRIVARLSKSWDPLPGQIAMMGFQAQTVVGSSVTLIQAVYLVQFGARATILSDYLTLALPLNLIASCVVVAILVGVSVWYSWLLFVLGCGSSLVASLALTFPPLVYSDAEQQASFLSHYFGILFIVASIGAKFRDFPNGLARVYILRSMEARASESAYNKIFDVIVGNGVNGALMLSLLARPTTSVEACLAALMVFSSAVSLRGGTVLRSLQETSSARSAGTFTVIGAQCEGGPEAEGMREQGHAPQEVAAKGRHALVETLKLTANVQMWQLLLVDWCAGFIFTLNSQAAGSIYWSSVVSVDDSQRSVFIALESALGGGLMGFVTTLYATRLYHRQAPVSVVIPRIVACGAVFGCMMLALFGTTRAGALVGITSLYLYYFIYTWSNIEFLNLLDVLKAKYFSDNTLLYAFLIKDIAGGVLNNLRNMILMWLLAVTGFYEPDCNAKCASADSTECVAQCHADSHASVTGATTTVVRALYVVVTPGAYLLACILMRAYSKSDVLE